MSEPKLKPVLDFKSSLDNIGSVQSRLEPILNGYTSLTTINHICWLLSIIYNEFLSFILIRSVWFLCQLVQLPTRRIFVRFLLNLLVWNVTSSAWAFDADEESLHLKTDQQLLPDNSLRIPRPDYRLKTFRPVIKTCLGLKLITNGTKPYLMTHNLGPY